MYDKNHDSLKKHYLHQEGDNIQETIIKIGVPLCSLFFHIEERSTYVYDKTGCHECIVGSESWYF